MQTAVSLPLAVYAAAEELARERGISREQLYAEAIESYVARLRDDDVTARLDAVYSEAEATLDPVLQELQARTVGRPKLRSRMAPRS